MLMLHIVTAVVSLIWTALAVLRPAKKKLYVSYALTGATLASGTLLVIQTHAPLTQACISGVIYLAAVMSGIFATRRRLTANVISGS